MPRSSSDHKSGASSRSVSPRAMSLQNVSDTTAEPSRVRYMTDNVLMLHITRQHSVQASSSSSSSSSSVAAVAMSTLMNTSLTIPRSKSPRVSTSSLSSSFNGDSQGTSLLNSTTSSAHRLLSRSYQDDSSTIRLECVTDLDLRPLIRNEKFHVIENLEKLSNLVKLNLSDNAISKIENLSLSHLVHLNLDNNQIRKIENLEHCPKIEELSLRNNLISRLSGQKSSKSIKALKQLQELHLDGNRLGTLNDLKTLCSLDNLAELSILKGNPIASLEHSQLYIVFTLNNISILDGDSIDEKLRSSARERFEKAEIALLEEQRTSLCMEIEQLKREADQKQVESLSIKESTGRLRARYMQVEDHNQRIQEELDAKNKLLDKKSRELHIVLNSLYTLQQRIEFLRIDHPEIDFGLSLPDMTLNNSTWNQQQQQEQSHGAQESRQTNGTETDTALKELERMDVEWARNRAQVLQVSRSLQSGRDREEDLNKDIDLMDSKILAKRKDIRLLKQKAGRKETSNLSMEDIRLMEDQLQEKRRLLQEKMDIVETYTDEGDHFGQISSEISQLSSDIRVLEGELSSNPNHMEEEEMDQIVQTLGDESGETLNEIRDVYRDLEELRVEKAGLDGTLQEQKKLNKELASRKKHLDDYMHKAELERRELAFEVGESITGSFTGHHAWYQMGLIMHQSDPEDTDIASIQHIEDANRVQYIVNEKIKEWGEIVNVYFSKPTEDTSSAPQQVDHPAMTDFQKRIRELERKNNELQKEVAIKEEEFENKQLQEREEKMSLQSQVEALQQTIQIQSEKMSFEQNEEVDTAMVKNLEDELQKKIAEIDRLRDEEESRSHQMKGMEESEQELQQELSDTDAMLSSMEHQLQESAMLAQELRDQLEEQKESVFDMSKKVEMLEEELREVKEAKDSISREAHHSSEKLRERQTVIDTLTKRVHELDSQIQKMISTEPFSKDESAALQSRIQEMEEEKESRCQQLQNFADMETKFVNVREQLNNMQGEFQLQLEYSAKCGEQLEEKESAMGVLKERCSGFEKTECELHKEIQRLTSRLEEKDNSISEEMKVSKEELKQLTTLIAEKESQIEDASQAKAASDRLHVDEITQRDETISILKTKIDSLREEKEVLSSAFHAAREQTEATRQRLETQIGELEASITKHIQERNELENAENAAIEDMGSKIDSVEEHNRILEVELQSLRTKQLEFEKVKHANEQRIDELREHVETLTVENDDLNTEKSAMMNRFQSENDALQERLHAVEQRAAELEHESKQLKESHCDQIREMESEVYDLQSQKESCEASLADMRSEMSSNVEALGASEHRVQELQEEMERIVTEMSNVSIQYEERLHALQSANNETVASLKEELMQRVDKSQRLIADLETLRQQVQDLDLAMAALSHERELTANTLELRDKELQEERATREESEAELQRQISIRDDQVEEKNVYLVESLNKFDLVSDFIRGEQLFGMIRQMQGERKEMKRLVRQLVESNQIDMDKATSRLHALSARIQEMMEERHVLCAEKKDLESRLQHVQEQLDISLESKQQLTSNLSALRSQFDSKMGTVAELERHADDVCNHRQQIEEQLRKVMKANGDYESKVDGLTKSLETMSQEKERLSEEMQNNVSARMSMEEEIHMLQMQIQDIKSVREAQVSASREEVSRLTEERDSIQRYLKERESVLQEKVSLLQSEIEILAEDKQMAESHAQELETKVAETVSAYDTLQEDWKKETLASEHVSNEYQKLLNIHAEVYHVHAEQKKEIETLQRDLNKQCETSVLSEQKIQNYNERVKELENRLLDTSVLEEKVALENSMELMRVELSAVREKYETVCEERDDVSERMDKELRDLSERVATLESSLDRKTQANAKLHITLQELKQKEKSIKNELNTKVENKETAMQETLKKCAELEGEVNTLSKELVTVKDRQEDWAREMKVIEEQRNLYSTTIDDMYRQLTDSYQPPMDEESNDDQSSMGLKLLKRLRVLKQNMLAMTEKEKQARDNIERLESQRQELLDSIQQAEQQRDGMSSSIEEMKEVKEKLKVECEQVQLTHTNTTQKNNEMKENNATLTENIKNNEQKIRSQQEKISQLAKEQDVMHNEVVKYANQIKEAESELTDALEQKKKLYNDIQKGKTYQQTLFEDQLNTDLVTEERDNLLNAVRTLNGERASLEYQIKSLKEEAHQMTQCMSDDAKEFGQLQQAIQQAHNFTQRSEKQITSLKAELESLAQHMTRNSNENEWQNELVHQIEALRKRQASEKPDEEFELVISTKSEYHNMRQQIEKLTHDLLSLRQGGMHFTTDTNLSTEVANMTASQLSRLKAELVEIFSEVKDQIVLLNEQKKFEEQAKRAEDALKQKEMEIAYLNKQLEQQRETNVSLERMNETSMAEINSLNEKLHSASDQLHRFRLEREHQRHDENRQKEMLQHFALQLVQQVISVRQHLERIIGGDNESSRENYSAEVNTDTITINLERLHRELSHCSSQVSRIAVLITEKDARVNSLQAEVQHYYDMNMVEKRDSASQSDVVEYNMASTPSNSFPSSPLSSPERDHVRDSQQNMILFSRDMSIMSSFSTASIPSDMNIQRCKTSKERILVVLQWVRITKDILKVSNQLNQDIQNADETMLSSSKKKKLVLLLGLLLQSSQSASKRQRDATDQR